MKSLETLEGPAIVISREQPCAGRCGRLARYDVSTKTGQGDSDYVPMCRPCTKRAMDTAAKREQARRERQGEHL